MNILWNISLQRSCFPFEEHTIKFSDGNQNQNPKFHQTKQSYTINIDNHVQLIKYN